MNKGVLYVATSTLYINECIESVKTLKKIHPEIQTCIFADKADGLDQYFDKIIIIPDPKFNFHDKVYGIRRTPFDQTLFLDTDTIVVKPIDDLFETLEFFDIGFALDNAICSGDYYDLPKTFGEPNSGVLIFKLNDKMNKVLAEWEQVHAIEEQALKKVGKLCPDQPSLRAVLYKSDARMFVLPYGYNFITNRAIPIESFTDIKIVHGREPWATTIANNPVLNDQKLIKRVYLPASHFRSVNVVLGGYANIPETFYRIFRGLIRFAAKSNRV